MVPVAGNEGSPPEQRTRGCWKKNRRKEATDRRREREEAAPGSQKERTFAKDRETKSELRAGVARLLVYVAGRGAASKDVGIVSACKIVG